jgi:YHS domain-containing protein
MRRKILPQAALLWALAGPALAVTPVNTKALPGVAIKGYDPVAWFEGGAPAAGSEAHTVDWMGASWRFTSAEHAAQFEAAPERYAPQYGGWCAYAVANGRTADIDPRAWAIVDGKLYLNYSLDIKAKWDADREAFIQKADENWPGLKDQ